MTDINFKHLVQATCNNKKTTKTSGFLAGSQHRKSRIKIIKYMVSHNEYKQMHMILILSHK